MRLPTLPSRIRSCRTWARRQHTAHRLRPCITLHLRRMPLRLILLLLLVCLLSHLPKCTCSEDSFSRSAKTVIGDFVPRCCLFYFTLSYFNTFRTVSSTSPIAVVAVLCCAYCPSVRPSAVVVVVAQSVQLHHHRLSIQARIPSHSRPVHTSLCTFRSRSISLTYACFHPHYTQCFCGTLMVPHFNVSRLCNASVVSSARHAFWYHKF